MKMLILAALAVIVMVGCTATQDTATRGSPFVPFPPTATPTRLIHCQKTGLGTRLVQRAA